ncbi:SWIM zinc finger family protein [Eubacterium sp. 1001713B170207_170306_E7]|uniref:SWIM zinc finger family protein n=1 Tax=Eubacterium sp. 1001713B170207_170306_E7 TaxID=2787097 RepID=UPI001896C7B5|nr:SWIM zinc finger family protein [Eubacterium sp. 1001713B170207_170306_E7]
MKKWEDSFTRDILDSGYDLFKSDQVLEAVRCHNGYEAVVRDTKDYRVVIETEFGEITAMRCDCTFASEGAPCKHMAAALFALTESVADDFKDPWQYENTELYALVQGARENELRDFIYELACDDRNLSNRLWLRFFKGESIEELRPLERSLNAICKKYLGLEQFIPYWDATDFCDEIEQFYSDNLEALMDREHYGSAFDFTTMVYTKLCQLEIDDSEGDVEYLAEECADGWMKILSNIDDEAEERRMHRWFMNHLGGDTLYYLEDYVFDVFIKWNWRPVLLTESIKTVDWLIRNATPERLEYWLETYAVCRVQLMEMLELPKEAIEAYQEKYWHFSGIRNMAISMKIQNGEMDLAVRLINESMEMDKDDPDKISEYQRVLVWLYEKLGKPEALKKVLADSLVGEDFVNLKDFNKLKALCQEEEWRELREAIFKGIDYDHNLRDLYQEEGLSERLLESIRSQGDLSDLACYEETLKAGCPERTLELYAELLKDMVKKATNRRKYQQIADHLRKMQDYPGGPEKVRLLTADWRLRYAKRRALIEELGTL